MINDKIKTRAKQLLDIVQEILRGEYPGQFTDGIYHQELYAKLQQLDAEVEKELTE